MATYDYIIVGSGSAGSVLAYRLSELAGVSILVIEAGDQQIPANVDNPQLWATLHYTPVDWAYMTTPQSALSDRQIYSAAGKLIGGSSNIYHMIHIRGDRSDFDAWAYNGAVGWDWNAVLPYFQKLEHQSMTRIRPPAKAVLYT